ncbi:thiopeptide-type bacteriocin biosynthesis protein [Pedobacter mendelii]|uniref:Thiopeptide-type bacteriocin biosynthesis domain-containing protein n=1 Tax=Pedobacter mendelii TaxID=1908240 RepID=A0ABQ2BEZ7_9SPHI|nr:thiopeptide-type bacteriocin biosynthesis protein [Pedobacter mendelii]GGI23299.1 hypothetical protein GCM10008119_06950 [Pedobacter mendelii]
MEPTWLSAHIYFLDLELVLTELVKPFIDENKEWLTGPDAWFYIRYGEGGSHIRLRLHTCLASSLAELLLNAASKFYANYQFAFIMTGTDGKEYIESNCVKFLPYEPETSRYGGPDAIRLAEQYFMASSAITLERIYRLRYTPQNNFTEAIRHHLLLMFACKFVILEVNDICLSFIDNWLKPLCNPIKSEAEEILLWHHQFERLFQRIGHTLQVAAAHFWTAIENGSLDSEWLKFRISNILIMRQYLDAQLPKSTLNETLRSLMHMTHNRLGISNQEESYLMYCTYRCLQHILKEN